MVVAGKARHSHSCIRWLHRRSNGCWRNIQSFREKSWITRWWGAHGWRSRYEHVFFPTFLTRRFPWLNSIIHYWTLIFIIDSGNIEVDEDGVANINIEDRQVKLIGPHSIIGRSIVIKSNEDDQGRGGHETSLSTGNSGQRMAGGVVGIASS
jgi:Copper/zinc superoxide dismutase (SODC)